MTLSEVMHVHIPTLGLDSTFRDAADKMDIYQFPALVIVDSDKAPVAVVTEGDLARAITCSTPTKLSTSHSPFLTKS